MEISSPPNLLNPYNTSFFRHNNFPKYLGIDEFVEAVFTKKNCGIDTLIESTIRKTKNRNPPEELFRETLMQIPLDRKTVMYRQAIMQDLDNPDLCNRVESLTKSLAQLQRTSGDIEFLVKFQNFLGEVPDLTSAKSTGLLNVNKYFSKLSSSVDLHSFNEFMKKLTKVQGVHFVVTVDKFLRPRFINTIGVAIKGEPNELPFTESIFRELIGKELSDALRQGKVIVNEGITYDQRLFNTENRYGYFEKTQLGRELLTVLETEFGKPAGVLRSQFSPIFTLIPQLNMYLAVSKYFRYLKSEGIDVSYPEIFDEDGIRMEAKEILNWKLVHSKNRVSNNAECYDDVFLSVITGPNDGGKTTYMEAVGQTQLLAQQGFPIIGKSGKINLVNAVYTFTTSSETAKKGAGQFHQELDAMKDYIFNRLSPRSLLLVDELGRGTNYEEAEEPLQRILHGFELTKATTYFATHLHRLADYAESDKLVHARNLKAEFHEDKGNLVLTYRIVPGKAGKSYPGVVAQQIGFTDEAMERAIADRLGQRKP